MATKLEKLNKFFQREKEPEFASEQDRNLSRLEALVKIIEDNPSKEEIVAILEQMAEVVKRFEQQNIQAINTLESAFRQMLGQIQTDSSNSLDDIKGQVDKVFVEKRINEMMKKIDDKLTTIRNGIDGKHGRDGIDGLRGKIGLEGLPADNKLLKELQKEIEKLKEELKKPRRLGGGGNSDASTKFSMGRIVKKETPSGLINGSNTTYTVKNNIQIILSFAINGQVITDDEYTVESRTITMTTAIDSSLSGLSFRVIYI